MVKGFIVNLAQMSGITVPTLPQHAGAHPHGGSPPVLPWQARAVGTRSASLCSASASCLQPRLVIMARGYTESGIGPVIAKGCGAGRSDAGGRAWLQAGRWRGYRRKNLSAVRGGRCRRLIGPQGAEVEVRRSGEARSKGMYLLPSRAHLRVRLPGYAPGGQRCPACPAAEC